MKRREPRYRIGQLVHHLISDYRGVVVGIDPRFEGTEEWYICVALAQPPKDAPFYHVLPHGSETPVYVPERDLEADASGQPILNPLLPLFFDRFEDGAYHRLQH